MPGRKERLKPGNMGMRPAGEKQATHEPATKYNHHRIKEQTPWGVASRQVAFPVLFLLHAMVQTWCVSSSRLCVLFLDARPV